MTQTKTKTQKATAPRAPAPHTQATPDTTSAPAPAPPPLVGMPGSASAPSPPKGFIPLENGYRGLRSTQQQVIDAGDVARELTAPSYATDFPRAPDPLLTGTALLQAQAWSVQAAAADAWQAYVHEMRDRAWDAALSLTAKLAPKFADAVKDDADVAKAYPQTAGFLATRKTIAKRAVATRAKNRAAKKATPG